MLFIMEVKMVKQLGDEESMDESMVDESMKSQYLVYST